MLRSTARWIPTALFIVVSSMIVVALDHRFDFASGVVLLIGTVQILLAGFFFPEADNPYRRAPR